MTDGGGERTADRSSASRAPSGVANVDAAFLEYSRPWHFFAIAFGVSYLFWIPLVVLGYGAYSMPGVLLFAAGGLGVPGAAIYLLFRAADEEHRRDYWRRLVDVRRIGLRWYAVIFLLYPAINGLALALGLLAGDAVPAFDRVAELAVDPASILPYAAFMLVFGPLPEELGWRGYALDGLQARSSALTASLVLGVFWAVWHLPMFFMTGTFHAEIGVFTLPFWTFMVGAVVTSVLFTWIYNNTGRSTLSAILFHFSINFSGELVPRGELGDHLQFLLPIVIVVAVVLVYGPKTLSRPREEASSAG